MRRGLIILALLGLPLVASAQTRPDALWSLWQEPGSAISVTAGTREVDGDALRLRDVRVQLGTGLARTTVTFDRLMLGQTEDGAVRIDGASEARITAPGLRSDLVLDLSDTTILATRRSGEVRYDVVSDTLTLTETLTDALYTLTGLTGRVTDAGGASGALSMDLRADTLEGDLPPSGAGGTEVRFVSDAPRLTGALGEATQDLRARLDYGPTDIDTSRGGPEGPRTVTARVSGGRVEVGLEGSTLSVSQRLARTRATFAVPEYEAATVMLGGLDLEARMPVLTSDAPQDWSLDLDLRNLAPDADLRAALDPDATLPREPADLTLSATGTAIVTVPLGPETDLTEIPVPEMEVTDLHLTALGVEVTGAGAVAYPFGNGPPDGGIDITMTGLDGVVDRLATLGLIAPGQMILARLGLGLLTQDTADGTGRRTRLTFGRDGGLRVNGWPVN